MADRKDQSVDHQALGQAQRQSAKNPLRAYQIHKGPVGTLMVCFDFLNTVPYISHLPLMAPYRYEKILRFYLAHSVSEYIAWSA